MAAQKEFAKLGLAATNDHSSVLIYVAPRAQNFAIIGDSGVHQQCGDEFWRQVAAEMTAHFKQGAFTEGIVHGVHKAGELLAKHFPHHEGDENEVADDIAHD